MRHNGVGLQTVYHSPDNDCLTLAGLKSGTELEAEYIQIEAITAVSRIKRHSRMNLIESSGV